MSLKAQIERTERTAIATALTAHGYRYIDAADELGISWWTLKRKAKKYGLTRQSR